MSEIDCRLATYGSLSPGKPNHHRLGHLAGAWTPGTVKGRLVEAGWGVTLGFPALELDDGGADVAVHLFVSRDLPGEWAALDAFEGADYRRVMANVHTAGGPIAAWIYVAAPSSV